MKLSISSIAWDVSHDESVAAILKRHEITAIDIAPGKYFADFASTSLQQIQIVKNYWSNHGIDIIGMQSLLYGSQGLNMFGTPTSQQAMLAHMSHVCRIAQGLGAKYLVFGSPKNRDASGYSAEQARSIALDFLQTLAKVAHSYGVIICLEPSPAAYGSNFMVNTADTAAVVQAVNHPAIRMQLDTGAVTMNKEAISEILAKYAELIGHIHISEPQLAPLGAGCTDHRLMQQAISRYFPDSHVTIEMLCPEQSAPLLLIEQVLQNLGPVYRTKAVQLTSGQAHV